AVTTQAQVQNVRPSRTLQRGAEEAINFYLSPFKNSRILNLLRSDGDGPIPKGSVLHASFLIDGQEYTAFDGGEPFAFTEAFSFVATCETQEQIDDLWTRLTDGGEPGPCGWLKDRFGVSWQVVPAGLGEMLATPAKGNAAKLMKELLKIGQLDLAALQRAYRSGS